MEKYSQISYEPKTASIGIWGSVGLANEPFSLVKSDIETNALILAYENPVSVRGIADTMGMPSAYIEPIIDRLVEGELMGRTAGGLVYTRCFVQMYEDSFGDIAAQEELASQYASRVWEVAWKHLEPLTKREELASMSGKQIATMLLFAMNQALTTVVVGSRPDRDALPTKPPARPDTGCWLATLTVYEHGQGRDIKYEGSGPVVVNYKNEVGGRSVCRMYDCQSLFGEAHWAYGRFNYKCSLTSILRFYASLLPCDVKTDNECLYELIPEFEELGILKRGSDGEIGLDVPAITFDEMREHWEPAIKRIETELEGLLSGMLERLWKRHRNRVPKHVDEARYFVYSGSTGAYVKAQLLAIVEQGLLPYPVEIGKTPLICVLYRRCDG